MSFTPDPQVLDHLTYIREKVDRIDGGLSGLETRMLAAEGHLSSFFILQNRHSQEIEQLHRRLERLEQRLDISYEG